ncbi:hypothetical protein NLU13_0404 [Sarocladium strictum]|uniref:Nucleoside phosphorylase domain-containing protein n=1 Tax=Sarocladium strictum TaxID=5046 RepID=A0AA39LAS5_SARSR|nr:hypothetical protein NLU13_0404 [Sarocladium strictum]
MASLYQTLKQSNLLRCPASDILIIGEVHRLTRLLGGRRWEIAAPLSEIGHTPVTAAHDEDLFAWSRHRMTNGRSLTLLGCKEGLWGEAAGAVLRMLAEASKAKSFIYVGKVGALPTGYAPNQTIVTGDKAFFAEGPEGPASTSKVPLTWTNPLARAIETARTGIQVVSGDIVSVSTPLWETSDWLAKWRGKTDWVDCETAHMAQAAIATGVEFGYLHIVSDNLVAQNHENLSNEELEEVHEMRNQLYDMIEHIIITYLESAETTL